MEHKSINISESLHTCLCNFSGAEGDTRKEREDSLIKPFEALAKKMIYGGFLRVSDDYAIFIHKVEFYYHEEEGPNGVRVEDKIVYHRNGRFRKQVKNGNYDPVSLPYYPLMSVHSHWSGYDIAFESEKGKYRASALIREYVVYNLRTQKFIRLDTSKLGTKLVPESEKEYFVGAIIEQDTPYADGRSQYLTYYLNGFSLEEDNTTVRWIDFDQPAHTGKIPPDKRKNAPDHDWAFKGIAVNQHIHDIISSKAFQEIRSATVSSHS